MNFLDKQELNDFFGYYVIISNILSYPTVPHELRCVYSIHLIKLIKGAHLLMFGTTKVADL